MYSVTVIAVGSPASDIILQDLVRTVFETMVLCVGLDELKTIRSVERLKRDLRVSTLQPVLPLSCIFFN